LSDGGVIFGLQMDTPWFHDLPSIEIKRYHS
jgi:hypothetical protein